MQLVTKSAKCPRPWISLLWSSSDCVCGISFESCPDHSTFCLKLLICAQQPVREMPTGLSASCVPFTPHPRPLSCLLMPLA